MGPFETEVDARTASVAAAEPGMPIVQANLDLLYGACNDAGVVVGAYDARIVGWLAEYEPATCAVVAGLIIRAHEGVS